MEDLYVERIKSLEKALEEEKKPHKQEAKTIHLRKLVPLKKQPKSNILNFAMVFRDEKECSILKVPKSHIIPQLDNNILTIYDYRISSVKAIRIREGEYIAQKK